MKTKKLPNISMAELHGQLKKYRIKGLKPYLKGKGDGTIKIMFE